MALRARQPPPDAEGTLVRALDAAASEGTMNNAPEAEISASHPLRVFSLGAEDIVRGRGLDGALFVGWQYFLFEGERSLGSARVAEDAAKNARFSHFNQGPLADAELRSLRGLDGRVPAGDDFEPCLIEVPAVYFVGLLLAGAKPLIVPIDGPPEGFEIDRPYPAALVLSALRPEAERALAAPQDEP